MKKLLLWCMLSSMTGLCYAQDLMPKVAPVSPEAASLGKYGDLPVNLSTGRLAYSVPIFTIDVNGYQLPISLSYNNGGLLAEEDAGVVGLGWTLNAGGRIIRQLRGKPDEGSNGYVAGSIGANWVVPYNFGLWDNLSASERESKITQLYTNSMNGQWDLQPDKFIMNANGMGGSFSYNELGEAIFYPQKNYQITKTNDNYKIISSNGIIYDFNQKETTMGEQINTDDPGLTNYISSWGLTKVSFPTHDKEITLSYTTNASYVKSAFTESKRVRTGTNGANGGVCSTASEITSGEYVTTIANKINISSINFPQGTVEFDINHVSDGNGGTTSYLNSITVKDDNSNTISKYTFEYDNINSKVKLLQKIRKYDASNNELPFYSFQYNGTPPSNISYGSQDLWGFYNGKSGINLFSNDRGIDFNSASLGALTRINYPTGGYSEIEYESNRAFMLKDTHNDIQAETGAVLTPNKSEVINLTTTGSNSKTVTIPSGQFIKVSMITKYTSGNGLLEADVEVSSIVNGMSQLSCTPTNPLGDNCLLSATTSAESGGIIEGNKDYENYFYVEGGNSVTISASLQEFNTQGQAYIKLEYFEPTTQEEIEDYSEVTINNAVYITPRVGGIRVKSTSDCSTTGDCIDKTYKYVRIDGKTSGQLLLSSPLYFSTQNYLDANFSCTYKTTSTASKVASSSFQGSPVLYERVEVLQNGTTDNGKRVLTFSNDVNAAPTFPFLPIDTQDWKKGNLLTETTYANKSGVLVEISKTTNNYSGFYPYGSSATLTKRSVGMSVGRHTFQYGSLGQEIVDALNHLQDRSFNNRPEFFHLTSTVKEMDGITTTTNYTYDAITGNIEETTTTDSNGVALKKKNYYAQDVSDNTLIAENRVSIPVKTETFKGTAKLSTQNTVFANFNGHYLPSKVQASRGADSLEDRLLYQSYYSNGNIQEVSKPDGSHIVYIWGYDGTLPVAKIENASFSDIPTTVYNDIVNASNADTSTSTENTLRTKLAVLRNHVNLSAALVTTYTYDPLVGVTSITDPRGETIYYHYDSFHRLEFVKDAYGKIVSKNEYHFKN